MSKTRGLTLGKFVPLHKGHQLVIETALREMDEVMAIILRLSGDYGRSIAGSRKLVGTLYPSIQVVEAWDGPLEVGDTDEIRRTHEDYILNKLDVRGVTHFLLERVLRRSSF